MLVVSSRFRRSQLATRITGSPNEDLGMTGHVIRHESDEASKGILSAMAFLQFAHYCPDDDSPQKSQIPDRSNQVGVCCGLHTQDLHYPRYAGQNFLSSCNCTLAIELLGRPTPLAVSAPRPGGYSTGMLHEKNQPHIHIPYLMPPPIARVRTCEVVLRWQVNRAYKYGSLQPRMENVG